MLLQRPLAAGGAGNIWGERGSSQDKVGRGDRALRNRLGSAVSESRVAGGVLVSR